MRAPERSMAASLRWRMSPASSGCSGGVGAARAAAQPLVVELDERRRSGRARSAPAGGPAGHGGGGRGPAPRPAPATRRPARRAGGRAGSASHSCTSWTRALNALGLGGAEQVAVVLELGAAAGRVDQHRGVARAGRPSTRAGQRGGPRRPRPAWACSAPQQAAPRRRQGATPAPAASSTRCAATVDGPLPGVHHAAGEQPHVGARRPSRRAAGAAAAAGAGRTGGRRRGTSRARWAAASGGRAGQQEPVVAEHAEREPLPRGMVAGVGLGQRLPGALHQPAERDAGRAGRLAAAALHAGVDDVDEVVVDGERPPSGPGAWRRSGPRGDSASSPVTR